MAFKIASSPFTHNVNKTNQIMFWVILACLPGIAAQCYFFGYGNILQVILAIISALLSEAFILRLRRKPIINQLKDNSAIVTALLLGISIPAYCPWWIIVIGTCFAIIIAKQLYGGLGQNPFNPAMVGYVVLLIAFPIQMTHWPSSDLSLSFTDALSIIFQDQSSSTIDAISGATLLNSVKIALHQEQSLLSQNIIQQPDKAWIIINICFLIGGIILLLKKYISWRIPLGFLVTLSLLSWLSWLHDAEHYLSPILHLFSGATMLGAFFIATDPVTASSTPVGRLIFGTLIGALVWIIRTYGGYPDAVAFAVLLANMLVPLIDHYSQPRVYGH